MKKIFSLLFAFFLFYTLQAQIIFTEADVALPLTQYIRYNDTLPVSVTPGNTGANQTWDFFGLPNHVTDTLIFTNPQWTDYGTSFPSSNLCIITKGSDTSYMYLNNNPDSLYLVGQAGKFVGSPMVLTVLFDPTQKIANFPTTYLDGFTSNSKFSTTQYLGQTIGLLFFDSVKVIDHTSTTSLFDAWGNITTAIGTYNCLRANVVQIMNDSIFVKSNSLGTWMDVTSQYGGVSTSKRYGWWANGLGFNILEMDVDPVTDSVLEVRYLGALPLPGGLVHYEKDNDVIVFPNPASGTVNINTPENAFLVEVLNTSGQLMRSSKTNNTLVSHVDISGLPSGSYIIRISGNDGSSICHKNLIVE